MQKPSYTNTIIGAGIFAIAPLIFVFSQSNMESSVKLFLSLPYWIFIVYYLGVYFLLTFLIIPRLYGKSKIIGLLAVLLVLLAITAVIKPFDGLMHYDGNKGPMEQFKKEHPFTPADTSFNNLPPGNNRAMHKKGPKFDILSISLLLMVLMLVIADKAVKNSRVTEQRALQAEADKANAELSFLKAQINPHFLFNTLNNIYSLAVTKSEHAPDAIMRLSNIMRYVTDEANETMVPLQDEIDCINDYISLQKLRLGEAFVIEFTVTGNVMAKQIPPLVLMTFVENAFKHGVSNHEQSGIIFKMLAQDKYIHFFAQNKLFQTPRNAERTGVGIENTMKRLKVLYPEKHLLKIAEENGLYEVELVLYS